MKEYSILQRHGSGQPYIIHNFNNIDSAKLKLYEIIQLEEDRGRPYFVDNDFFINKYQNVKDLYYLQIIERDISVWVKYSDKENINDQCNSKIIFLKDYKKSLTN